MTDPYDYYKNTPAHVRMVSTSVQDCRSSLRFVTDPAVVRLALEHERTHMQRSGMIKMLTGKLKSLEKKA
jgi:hypothetical protein